MGINSQNSSSHRYVLLASRSEDTHASSMLQVCAIGLVDLYLLSDKEAETDCQRYDRAGGIFYDGPMQPMFHIEIAVRFTRPGQN